MRIEIQNEISEAQMKSAKAHATNKAHATKTKKSGHAKGKKPTRLWVAKVTTESTYLPEGLFTKSAAVIARTLASRKVSPKGPSSGMRMLNYFVNRGGKGLSAARKAELKRAKALLSKKIAAAKKPSRQKAA
jgi:tRNA(adenine34) deaminase